MSTEQIREQLLEYGRERDNIEAEIKRFSAVLDENGVGMNESLVDENDFPRADIDVYQVRHARHKIICLQSDHKNLMKKIEETMHQLHALYRISSSNESSASTANTNGHTNGIDKELSVNYQRPKSIAKVNLVSPGSPAETAGIKVDDEIIGFGSINAANFKSMAQIAEIVEHSVNLRVNVKILRNPGHQIIDIPLTPHTWAGRGLLGCNIIPISTSL